MLSYVQGAGYSDGLVLHCARPKTQQVQRRHIPHEVHNNNYLQLLYREVMEILL